MAGTRSFLFRINKWKGIIYGCRQQAGLCRRKYAVHVSDALFVAARDLLAYGILIAGVLDGTFSIAEFTLGLGVVTGLAEWFWNLRYHISYLLEGNLMICEYRKMMDCPDKFLREEGMSVPSEWHRQFPKVELMWEAQAQYYV